MNDAVYEWVSQTVADYSSIWGRVLEIGSLDVNGSVRPIFEDRYRFPIYVGVDIRPGVGVDQVCDSHMLVLKFGVRKFDVLVCTETLEHDSLFWRSLEQFYEVLSSDGCLILTTRGFGYPKHDHPSDYWRFSPEGLRSALKWAGFKVEICGGPEQDWEGALGTHALAYKR